MSSTRNDRKKMMEQEVYNLCLPQKHIFGSHPQIKVESCKTQVGDCKIPLEPKTKEDHFEKAGTCPVENSLTMSPSADLELPHLPVDSTLVQFVHGLASRSHCQGTQEESSTSMPR